MSAARIVLDAVTKQAPDYLPAWNFLARLDQREKNYDAALASIETALHIDPENIDARLGKGDILLAKGNAKDAIETFLHLERDSESFRSNKKAYLQFQSHLQFQLARAHLLSNDPPKAIAALNTAVASNPDHIDAGVLLAELKLRTGDAQSAKTILDGLLTKQPGLPQARLLLAEALRQLGQLEESAAELQRQAIAAPNNAAAHIRLGTVLLQQNKTSDARAAFEKALTVEPNNLAAAYQLIDLDIAPKNVAAKNFAPTDLAAALRRAEGLVQSTPKVAAVHFLKGRVLAAEAQLADTEARAAAAKSKSADAETRSAAAKLKWAAAEAACQQAVDLNPNFSSAYGLLADCYLRTGKLTKALEQLEKQIEVRPDNPPPLMLAALLYEKAQKYDKARETYEKLLARNSDNSSVLNNLAYLYAERFNDLDKAHEKASKARQLDSEDGAIADTLGWILFRRGEYQAALPLLKEAGEKLREHPEVQFHFGMASYAMGQAEAATAAFKRAVESPVEFPGKDKIPVKLALLEADVGGLSPDMLKAHLAKEPRDVVALLRLGEAHEKAGEHAKAAEAYNQAIKVNSGLVTTQLKLAELNAGPLQDRSNALEFARKARELAPSDPHVAGVLRRDRVRQGRSGSRLHLVQRERRQVV